MTPSLLVAATGLQEGGQNSVNKTPIAKRHSPSPASTDESIQLANPSSSPTTKPNIRANETQVDASKPHKSAPAPKTKRRLTLHGGSYERQTSHKRRKTQPKRRDGIQTTLSLAVGSSAGMRECKLCDTVYNPFHPEDVKVHAKRHAVAVKRERRTEEISGLTGSSPVD
ncbi:putative vacuolar er assembly vma12 [Diaporthe ampelina]|uniref:Putative vacuolar er assembly vma12 n=1 Tax=Diaporthe ampelina TaxID=1214573 RepID=A0A0G2FXR6_9PEZI|nr:putative vacuolar er assembly vma12 [Diaporthe ampelina]